MAVEILTDTQLMEAKQGGDITFEDMVDEQQPVGPSQIQKLFAGSAVLLTGGTGFLGKLIIEKLLRSCPDLKKIFLLARPKRNKDIAKRLQEQFDDVLYDRLRKECPDFIRKISIVEGDMGLPDLGMCAEDRAKIMNEVEVIFHGAATVRFDEPLKTAVEINVRGTREMFKLARGCTKLKAFVHISTAYSNCPQTAIGEKFYDSPLPGDKLIDLVESMDEKVLNDITPGLLGEFPNTYAYTKAVAENIVLEYSKGLPVALFRPSIVIGTAKEPVSGWIDNVYGPTGVVVGAAVGLLHVLRGSPRVRADLVPGDMAVSACVAAASRTARDAGAALGNHEDAPPPDLAPPVYNYVASEQKPLTWEKFMHYNEVYGFEVPSVQAIYYYLFILTPSHTLYSLYCFLLHWVPAYIIDAIAVIFGKKPIKNIVTKSGLQEVLPCSVGLQFFAEINNTSGEEVTVEVHPDECCLEADDARCNVVEVVGSASDTVPEGSTSTLHLVAPLLGPYDRKGFCTIHVDYNSKSRPKKFIRDTIKIKFDTTLQKLNAPDDATICKHIDEDPLNDCKPVYCDTYYNGRKSYFNVLKKRCVEVPACLTNAKTEIPKTAYNPVSNKCVDKPAITKEDINFIKALTGGKSRPTKDVLIINTTRKNCSVLPNDKIQDLESYTISRVVGLKTTTRPRSYFTAKKMPKLAPTIRRFNCLLTYVMTNKNTLLALSGIILVQCCLICTMVYCFAKSCACCKKQEVVNKFFNYRQDASVTTPLICTSNIDTETTDYQYLSESSNYIDKKIRCYKACQKERKTSCKLSMSDDILSKCITRRDWHRLPRSETIPEVRIDDDLNVTDHQEILEQRKLTDTKVNFQDEKRDAKKTKSVKSIVKKVDNRSNAGTLSDSSEKVIKCHNYEGSSKVTDFKNSGHGKTFGYKQDKNTDSIEQGAQAYFSNDSIDDFLSERGVLFIGDNASKYSFSSMSSANNSSRSSKTSKNNVMRNVIPFLSRKGKGPSSDPGLKKSKADLDLEVLHMSRVSMCSSSNGSDLCKDLKRIKDSTSSL